jgi:hypothetical protein
MMVWVTLGAARPIGLATWRAIHSVAASCWVIASTICARDVVQVKDLKVLF